MIEILVVISIIGFVAAIAVFSVSAVRKNSRDAMRAAHIASITKALALYQNDVQSGFPVSTGECLTDSSPVATELKNRNTIPQMPSDVLWSATAPSNFNGGATQDFAISPSSDFCYWYYATPTQYYVSYFLESSSKAGSQGIHVTSN